LYYISYTKLCITYNIYKKQQETTPSPSAVRRGFILLQVRHRAALEAGGHDLHRLLHSFLSGGFHFRYGALQDWSQGDDGVVAPEAGKDAVNHHPSKLLSFSLEARDESGLQVLQTLSGRVQHRKYGADQRRSLCNLDGT
jgi:hypothetical protein